MNGQEYVKMIYSIAHKYSFGNDFEDLCQVGQLGLLKAYENYNKDIGSNFSSYAYLYIKGEKIQDSIKIYFVSKSNNRRISGYFCCKSGVKKKFPKSRDYKACNIPCFSSQFCQPSFGIRV